VIRIAKSFPDSNNSKALSSSVTEQRKRSLRSALLIAD